jgi:hypothetical protein
MSLMMYGNGLKGELLVQLYALPPPRHFPINQLPGVCTRPSGRTYDSLTPQPQVPTPI